MKSIKRNKTVTWIKKFGGKLEQVIEDDSWKYNEDGYINIDGYMSRLNPNWKEQDTFAICNATRNNGKSTGMWGIVQDDWRKSDGSIKAGYCRTNGEKVKHAKENFNATHRGDMYMNDSKIYKQSFDEKGKEILSARKEYGSVFSLAQAENYKSGIFDNYQWFFWDEYNESITDRNQFMNFIDLLKTVKRKTSPFHVMLMGNKVNETNDILHNLEIDLDEIPNPYDDYLIEFAPNMYFIEIGDRTFKHHNPESDIIHRLAAFNERTNAYLNEGTYMSNRCDGLILFSKYVEWNREIFCYFSCDEYLFEFGDFYHKSNLDEHNEPIDENDTHIYFHMVKKIPDNNDKPIYSINTMGDIRNADSHKMNDKQLEKFFKMIKHNAKIGKLWFCEMDTKLEIEYYICKLFT